MANEKLKKWQRENDISDAEVMAVLGLRTVNQFKNRMTGQTNWSPLEKKTLATFAGMSEDELFERG